MRQMLVAVLTACGLAFGAYAHAKLPAPGPEQEAKAAEAKAKAAEAAKKEADLLGRAQDRAADNYRKGKGKAMAAGAVAGGTAK